MVQVYAVWSCQVLGDTDFVKWLAFNTPHL